MGFMDKLSQAFGGDEKAASDTVKGPSATLREHGIDPSNLKFGFNQDGSVTVSGHVQDQAECDRICEVVGGIPNVSSVKNNMVIGAPEPAPQVDTQTPDPAPEQDDAGEQTSEAASKDPAARTYTVQSGDTLWAIAQKEYGSGGKYMKIFEANTSLLESPDKIFPGQELVIPDLEES